MGQFGNQPDFATSSIQEITVANGFISDTPSLASKLNGAVIYIGDNSTVGNELKVIPAGVLGPFIVSGFNAVNNGGIQYTDSTNLSTTTTGSGTGLTVDITAAVGGNQEILTIAVNTPGTGYENGDFIEVIEGGQGGVDQAKYRVQVSAGLPTAAQGITFKGLGTGGFLPVTVDYVLATGTTVAELIAAK